MCTSVVDPPCRHPSRPPLRGGGCESPAGGSSAALPTISPEGIHRYLLKAHRLGNRVNYRFILGLHAIEIGELWKELGATSTHEYAEEHFGWERSMVYDALRVVERLEELPLTKNAYIGEGLAYSRVEEITQVATPETEAEWIDFARKNKMKGLRLEVRNARETGRKRPRRGSYGLPGVKMKLPFALSSEEYALVEKALRKIAKELSGKLAGPEEFGPREALLFLAKRVLETDPATALEGRVEREDSIYTILYHQCLDCHRAHLVTEDGPVEVSAEGVDRVKGRAHKVEIRPEEEVPPAGPPAAREPAIDRPNPRSLLRRLYLRDGRVCANPRCRRTDHLQGHHIDGRAEGGRTALWNEVLLCPMCHAMVELGLIEIVGNPLTGLEFRTRGEKIAADFRAESEEVAEIPVVVAVRSSGNTDGSLAARNDSAAGGSRLSGNTDNGHDLKKQPVKPQPDEVDAFEDSVRALEKLDFPKREALSRALKALERLRGRGEKPIAEALVKEAFRVRG